MPGKIMGLQSYGRVIEKYSKLFGIELLNYPISKFEGDAVFENKDWLDFVASAHNTLVNHMVKLFEDNFDKSKPIGYTGGVALNVVINQRLKEEGFDIKIPPHCGDEGLSIGALAYLGKKYDFEVKFDNFPFCQSDEPSWDTADKQTIKRAAEDLANGKVVLWYNGHGEVGPRALGNRSILMDPTIKNGKQKINAVKKREPWRPFGASVKQDQAHRFFEMTDSPFMMYNSQVKYSGIPAVTHRDGTCRHNTVTPEMNPVYYELLDEFEKLTGLPVLLNTSANLQGEAICGTREQAIELYNRAKGIDTMVIGSKTWIR
jgi:carbamoyltransferase